MAHKLSDRRGRHDAAYRRAKEEQFAGRAVYKLEEIDKRFRLLARGKRVLDLGCWPGSWLQYAAEKVGDDGLVVGIDLNEVEVGLPGWVTTAVGDVEDFDPRQLVDRFGEFDVVLSDMAPNTTGDRHTDQWRSEELWLRALEVAGVVLRRGGHFAGKVFQGGRFKQLIEAAEASFDTVKPFRPKNTRARSLEQYIVAKTKRA